MATWKKVIVSGSNISQLFNDAGYITSGMTGNSFATASFNGQQLIANSMTASLNFASSSGQGLTISANAITDTLTFGLSNIPNSSLANPSVTIGNTTINLGSTVTQINGVGITGSFTGSFTGNGSGLTGVVTILDISGSTGGGSVNLQTQVLSVVGTTNEIETSAAGQTITIGLPNNVTIGNNLTVTGDLFVNGTATYINTADLYVEDKFILLSSGSTGNGDGGLIIDRGSFGAGNIAFGYDSATGRWGFQDGLADSTNALDTTSANGVSGSFIAHVFTETAHGTTKPITGEFAKEGAIYTAISGDIWIYS